MIPNFQPIMLPLLQILSDKQDHKVSEILNKISNHFNLTEEERVERLPSGTLKMYNRVYWAITDLKFANLLFYPSRGYCQITESGINVLASSPEKIDVKYLQTIPRYMQWREGWRSRKKSNIEDAAPEESIIEDTPEELLDSSYIKLKEVLSSEIIDKVKSCTPHFFEVLVVDLLIKMGYGGSRVEAGEVIGKSNDGGIDGIIKEDKLGLDAIYIQAKKWENIVPISQIRDFAGSLLSKKAKKGIFITTSSFPKTAYEFVTKIEPRIVLIDGVRLAELMIEYNIGVAVKNFYEIKKIDSDYFEES